MCRAQSFLARLIWFPTSYCRMAHYSTAMQIQQGEGIMAIGHKMKESYESNWAEYGRICRYFRLALIATLTLPFLIVLITSLLMRFKAFQFLYAISNLPFLLGCVLLFAALYFAYVKYTWNCPRCGRRFGQSEECGYCSLPRLADQDDGAEWTRSRI